MIPTAFSATGLKKEPFQKKKKKEENVPHESVSAPDDQTPFPKLLLESQDPIPFPEQSPRKP
jgi:hypothetical protein